MAVYNSGSVRVRAGSAGIRGNNTDFVTYVSIGDLFKITSESSFYDVAAIVNATNLTLSGRYANTDQQTSRSENVASGTTATKMYDFNLTNTPVIQNYVVITASLEQFTDNGAGVLTSDASPQGSGSVSYDDGAVEIILGTDLTATINITASYYSGNTLNSMPYQIVKDFSSHYDFPELSLIDTHFQDIYTKAIRLIDSAIYDASVNTIKSASDVEVTASQRGVILTSPDGTSFRVTVSNTGTLTATTF